MSIVPTEFNDPETGNHYLILYSRELVGHEMQQAVQMFKPRWVYESKSSDVLFIVTPDSDWRPVP
jgi:hypothetical protein